MFKLYRDQGFPSRKWSSHNMCIYMKKRAGGDEEFNTPLARVTRRMWEQSGGSRGPCPLTHTQIFPSNFLLLHELEHIYIDMLDITPGLDLEVDLLHI